MAFSGKTLGRPTSTGSVSLAEGVKITLSQHFQPPSKVTLPLNYEMGNPTEVLFQEYDFSLEEKVLQWTKAQLQVRRDLSRAETNKIGDSIEQFAQSEANQEDHSAVPAASSNKLTNGHKEKSVAQQFLGTNMLMPTPIEATNTQKPATPQKRTDFNVADFERESDPFDNVELQTLNEMEELDKVLQRSTPQAPPESAATNLKDVQYPEFESLEQTRSTNPFLNAGKLPPINGAVQYPPPPLANYPDVSVDYQQGSVSYKAQNLFQSSAPEAAKGLRSAKSTPDISQVLNDTNGAPLKKAMSHTPPPYPCRVTPPPQRPSSNQTWNPYTPLSSTASSAPPLPPPRPPPSRPDPYAELGADSQKLVDNLIVMGFNRGKTARTVQHVGENDKQVVEYLCAMNRLSDAGADVEAAEDAVLNFKCNEEQTKQYLKLLAQFQELGFDSAQIKDALIKSTLDEEKTLDLLTGT